MWAQSVIDYSGISVSTAARDIMFSVKNWFRTDPQAAWLLIGGLVLLFFFLRRKRRLY